MPLYYFRTFLNEAEVDGQPIGEEEVPADYTSEGEPSQNQAVEETQPTDQPPADTEPTTDANEPPVDYTQDMYSGENPQDGGAPADNGTPPPNSGEISVVDDLKHQEEELYSELTPEQLDIKHKELKTQYLNMYDNIVAIIDRIGDINVAEQNIGTVEYVSNTLASLKDMLTDYVNDVYKTKSYIENSINYNRFLAILNGINKILEEMNSKNDEK